MTAKHLLKWLSQFGWLAFILLLAVVLIGLFNSGRGGPLAAPTPVPALPSPPFDDEFRPASTPIPALPSPGAYDANDSFFPTRDPHAPPTWTPNSPPPTIDPTFSALPKVAPPTGQPPKLSPTNTPLPTLSASSTGQFSVQNLRFGPAVTLSKELVDPFGDIVWSPDGQALAFSLAVGGTKKGSTWPLTDIALVDANGRNVRRLAPGFDPVWSPSGNLIAHLDYGDNLDEGYIRIVDVNTRQVTQVTTIKRGSVYPVLAWASDTELLYYQDTVILYDYRTGEKSNLFELVTPSFLAPSPSPFQILVTLPDHNLMAVASGHVLVILERDKHGFHVLKQLEGVDNPALAFSPDGDVLAYVSMSRRKVKIVATRGEGTVVELPGPGRGTPTSLAWSPDGAALVYADFDGVHLVNRDGSGLQKVEGLPGYVHRLAWSPCGTLTLSINTSDIFFTFFSLPASTGR